MSDTYQRPQPYNPVPLGPDFGKAIADAARMVQLQQVQEQVQKGNALQNIMKRPGALDAMGQPTPETMQAVMGVDVNAGLKLRQASLTGATQQAALQEHQAKRYNEIQDMLELIRSTSMEAYTTTPGDDAAKRAAAQKVLTEGLDGIKTGGGLSDAEKNQLNPQFDPVRIGLMSVRWQQQQEKLKADARADKKDEEQGWQPVLDTANLGPDGRPTEIEYNPRSNKARTLIDSKPYQPPNPPRISASGQKKEYGKPEVYTWTGADGKSVRQTIEEDANGGWVDAVTRNPVQPGKDMRPVPPGELSKEAGGVDDATADRMALQMSKGQPVSQLMGTRNQADIDKVQNRLTKLYADQGKSPEEAASLATQAANRWHSAQRTYDNFVSGGQGTPAGQIVAANTAIQHIAVARSLIPALRNGDMNTVNKIWQAIRSETGDPAPTNMDAVAQFVSNEVSRASAGAALTGEERSAMASDISKARSPQQLNGALDRFQQLLAGKVGSLRNQYQFGTGIKDPKDPYSFEHLVKSPETLKALGWVDPDASAGTEKVAGKSADVGGAVTGTGGTWKDQPIPEKAIGMLKKSPDMAAAFDAQFQSPGLAASILGAKAAPAAPAGYPDPSGKNVPGPAAPRDALPAPGVLQGQLHLDTMLAPNVPKGAPRPFAPGEYIRNPNGGWSSEISVTVDDPRLNGGKATVIPSLWVVDGKPYRAKNEDEAVDFALKSKLPFRSFPDMDAAEKFATDREAAWQKLDQSKPETARSIPSLWAAGPRADAAPPTAPTTEGAPEKTWAVPEKHAKDPDGTAYNGGKYVKRGDKIVRAQADALATSPADEAKHLERARFALKQGAKKEDVEKELRAAGIDPGKL